MDTGLASRTFFPSNFGTFVTSDMYVFRGKYIYDFEQNVFNEFECFFFSYAEHIVTDTPLSGNFVRAVQPNSG